MQLTPGQSGRKVGKVEFRFLVESGHLTCLQGFRRAALVVQA
jgi:hypothetical protein